jgi:hypothetical protein
MAINAEPAIARLQMERPGYARCYPTAPMKLAFLRLLPIALIVSGCSVPHVPMNQQGDHDPWVIRTDFSDAVKWATVCDLIAAPQRKIGQDFYAYVQYKDDERFANLEPNDVVHSLPDDYPGFLCFVVDAATLNNDDHPVLVIGFSPNSTELEDYQRTPKQTPLSEIKTFRAVPSAIQSIQNNLSIANMDFEDFADCVDTDGVFRGFPR